MAPVVLLILFTPRSTVGLNVILKAESLVFPCAAASRWKSDPILECHSHLGVSGANGKHIYSNRLRWSEVTKAPVRVLMTHIEFASVSDSCDSLPEVFRALYAAENASVPFTSAVCYLDWCLQIFYVAQYVFYALTPGNGKRPSISPNSAIMANGNLLKVQKQAVNHSLSS